MESPPIFNRFWSFSQYSNFASVRKINILIDTTIWIHDTYAQFVAPLKRKRGRKKMLLKKKRRETDLTLFSPVFRDSDFFSNYGNQHIRQEEHLDI